MAKEIKEVKLLEEVSRVKVDNDHILITYSDGSTETRLV